MWMISVMLGVTITSNLAYSLDEAVADSTDASTTTQLDRNTSDDIKTTAQQPQLHWRILTPCCTWCGIAIVLFLTPFLKSTLELSNEFKSSGRINLAVSRIESLRVIPSIVSMIETIMDERKDGRTKLKGNIEELLNGAQYNVFLDKIRDAMGEMDQIEDSYQSLLNRSKHIWYSSLVNIIATLCFAIQTWCPLNQYVLIAIWSTWGLSFAYALMNLIQFRMKHEKLTRLTESREADDEV